MIALDPKTEAALRALAQKEHLPVETWLTRIVERETSLGADVAAPGVAVQPLAKSRAKNLVELFADSPLKGSGIVIERDPSPMPGRRSRDSDAPRQ